MKQKDNQIVWFEKYRPTKVADCVLPEDLKTTFQNFVNKKDFPNLILAGRSGVGKTTVARAMLDELKKDYIVVNGSLEGRQIDTLRNELTNYVTQLSLKSSGRKYVIIDEADFLNAVTVQPALRKFMEDHAKNAGFILTCNYKAKILDALHSRCSTIDFTFPKSERPVLAAQIFKSIGEILKSEGVEFDPKVVANVISKHFPDFRKTINELQRMSIQGNGKIDAGSLVNSQQNFVTLMKFLKEKDFTNTTKWLSENSDLDSSDLYRTLYDIGHNYIVKQSIGPLVLIIAKYQYQDAFAVDKEINTAACLLEIMAECQFK